MNGNQDSQVPNIQQYNGVPNSLKNEYYIEKKGQQGQLNFQGNYLNNLKVGTWLIYNQGQKIGGGNYNEQGMKHGRWIDVIDKYDKRLCPITFNGEYINGVRIGQWNTFDNLDVVGGGIYNENGQKEDLWTDIDENYSGKHSDFHKEPFKFFHIGIYRNGIRIGEWKTLSKRDKENYFGGFYDDLGMKQGKWTEIPLQNTKYPEIVFAGEYNNGLRIGHWKYLRHNKIQGGGYFDENGQKQGKWTDVDVERYFDPIFHRGEYKNGIRVGEWFYEKDRFLRGCGYYDENGSKIECWTEILWDKINYGAIRSFGGYKNGKRRGYWEFQKDGKTILMGSFNLEGELIDVDFLAQNVSLKGLCLSLNLSGIRFGKRKMKNCGYNDPSCGDYDVNRVKQGFWIEEDDSLEFIQGYYEDGVKIGKWSNLYKAGGGLYDDQGMKQGIWIENHSLYEKKQRQLIQIGQYQNDIRVGPWETKLNDIVIGGGLYDEKGIMQGEWKEINKKFTKNSYIIDQLIYNNGKLVSRVTQNQSKNTIIQSGKFNDQGLKEGHWIYKLRDKMDQKKYDEPFLFLSGEYKNGKRVGKWIYQYKDKQIGGGYYDKNGGKEGFWLELTYNRINFTESGLYQNDLRKGQWSINFYGHQIGGGNYNQNGKKQGIWIDAHGSYQYSKQLTFKGEYLNGIRVGQWQTLFKRRVIGGGTYDDQGREEGQWVIAECTTNWVNFVISGFFKEGRLIGECLQLEDGVVARTLLFDENGNYVKKQ